MKDKRQKRYGMIAILAAVIFSIGMVIAPLTVSAHINADEWEHFGMQLISTSYGYNTLPAWKYDYSSHFWVDYQYCSYGSNYPVNFLVIASNGVQISNNVIVNGSGQNGYTTYYSTAHTGEVRMRANTGSMQSGYYIYGEWAPNAYNCGCK